MSATCRPLPPRFPAKVKGEPWARLGVKVEDDFEPLYVVPSDKKKVISELKTALKGADELLLATDEDREGESIGWHLYEVLKPKVPVRRMIFHEITREAIEQALKKTRSIDNDLVRAQETRRILDRLVGYTISPLLWKKIAPKLSAGRVQSVAVRLLVLRERERRAFVSGSYWDLKAQLNKRPDRAAHRFEATLVSVNGTRVASGRDFDESTGRIAAGKRVKTHPNEGSGDVLLLDEEQARALQQRLRDGSWAVHSTESSEQSRSPSPPFTTSTLQQEANRKRGWGGSTHDAGGPVSIRKWLHHLYAYRLGPSERRGCQRGPPPGAGALRRAVSDAEAAPLQDEVKGRAGGA